MGLFGSSKKTYHYDQHMGMTDSWKVDKSNKITVLSALYNRCSISEAMTTDSRSNWGQTMKRLCNKIEANKCTMVKLNKGEKTCYVPKRKKALLQRKYKQGWEYAEESNPNTYTTRLYTNGNLYGGEVNPTVFQPFIEDAIYVYSYTKANTSCREIALHYLKENYNYSSDTLPESIFVPDEEDNFTTGANSDDIFENSVLYDSYESGLEIVQAKYGLVQKDTLESCYFITPTTNRPLLTVEGKDYYFCDIYQNDADEAEVVYCSISNENTGTDTEPKYIATFNSITLGLQDIQNSNVYYVKYLNTANEVDYTLVDITDNHTLQNQLDNSIYAKDCYPMIPLRLGKKSIDEVNPTYYEACKAMFDEDNFDFENIVGSYNAKKSLMDEDSEYDKDYADSLKDITQIQMLWALDLSDNDERVKKYFFYHFKDLADKGITEVHLQNGNTTLRNTWSKAVCTTLSGKLLTKSKYGIIVTSTKDGATLELIRQYIRNGAYACDIVTVSNFKVTLYIEGKWRTFTPNTFSHLTKRTSTDIANYEAWRQTDDGKEDAQFFDLVPILRHVLEENFSSFERVDLLQIGIRVIHHTKKVVKKKWYQTGLFKVVTFVISAILLYFFPPSGLAGLTTTTAGSIAITILICTAVSVAIKLVAKLTVKVFNLDGRWLGLLDFAITAVAMYFGDMYGISFATSASAIGLGNFVVSTVQSGFNLDVMLSAFSSFALSGTAQYLGALAELSTATQAGLTQSMCLLGNPQFLDAVRRGDWTTLTMNAMQIVASMTMTSFLTSPNSGSTSVTGSKPVGGTSNTSPGTSQGFLYDALDNATKFGFNGYSANPIGAVSSAITGKQEEQFNSLQKDYKNFQNTVNSNQAKMTEKYASILDTNDISNITGYLLMLQNLSAVNNKANFQVIKMVI